MIPWTNLDSEMSMESNQFFAPAPTQAAPVTSISIRLRPCDHRCRYWAKVVRANTPLPTPSQISGASDIPGAYLMRGEEELLPGDVLFEGEANHHRRTDRGWTYWVRYVTADGEVLCFQSGFGPQKASAKAQGMPAHLLAGSGDVAGAVRVGHALRMGLTL